MLALLLVMGEVHHPWSLLIHASDRVHLRFIHTLCKKCEGAYIYIYTGTREYFPSRNKMDPVAARCGRLLVSSKPTGIV